MSMKSEDGDEKLDGETVVRVSVAKRQWERTFDAISESLMILDEDYVIRRANLALADELGTAIQRVVGRRCFDVRSQSPQALVGAAGPALRRVPGPRRAASARRQGRRGAVEERAHAMPARVPAARRGSAADGVQLPRRHRRAGDDAPAGQRRKAGGDRPARRRRRARDQQSAGRHPGVRADPAARGRHARGTAQEYLAEIERSALRCKAIVESLLRFSRQAPQYQAPRAVAQRRRARRVRA